MCAYICVRISSYVYSNIEDWELYTCRKRRKGNPHAAKRKRK